MVFLQKCERTTKHVSRKVHLQPLLRALPLHENHLVDPLQMCPEVVDTKGGLQHMADGRPVTVGIRTKVLNYAVSVGKGIVEDNHSLSIYLRDEGSWMAVVISIYDTRLSALNCTPSARYWV